MSKEILLISNSSLVMSITDLEAMFKQELEKFGPWVKKFDSEDISSWYSTRTMNFIEDNGILYPAYIFLQDFKRTDSINGLKRHILPIKKILKYSEYLTYLAMKFNIHADKDCLWDKNSNKKFDYYYLDIKNSFKIPPQNYFTNNKFKAFIYKGQWIDSNTTEGLTLIKDFIDTTNNSNIFCPVTISYKKF